jgi:hypothetical protein
MSSNDHACVPTGDDSYARVATWSTAILIPHLKKINILTFLQQFWVHIK